VVRVVTIKVPFESLKTAFDQSICGKPSSILKFCSNAVSFFRDPDCTGDCKTALIHAVTFVKLVILTKRYLASRLVSSSRQIKIDFRDLFVSRLSSSLNRLTRRQPCGAETADFRWNELLQAHHEPCEPRFIAQIIRPHSGRKAVLLKDLR
jgi:hypothetical protein